MRKLLQIVLVIILIATPSLTAFDATSGRASAQQQIVCGSLAQLEDQYGLSVVADLIRDLDEEQIDTLISVYEFYQDVSDIEGLIIDTVFDLLDQYGEDVVLAIAGLVRDYGAPVIGALASVLRAADLHFITDVADVIDGALDVIPAGLLSVILDLIQSADIIGLLEAVVDNPFLDPFIPNAIQDAADTLLHFLEDRPNLLGPINTFLGAITDVQTLLDLADYLENNTEVANDLADIIELYGPEAISLILQYGPDVVDVADFLSVGYQQALIEEVLALVQQYDAQFFSLVETCGETMVDGDTVGAFYSSTGRWLLRDFNSSGVPTVPEFTYGRGGVPVVGDWNNDGTDTVGVFYPATGRWYLRDENSAGVPTVPDFTYGRGGVPVVGDWNNDGTDTVGVFYPATGRWYLRDENSAGAPTVPDFTYGRGGVPVVGDWNNDGTDTVGVFYPATGRWLLRDFNSAGVPTVPDFTYGLGGVPVVGDWNNDGTDTVGVFYRLPGTWLLRNENSAGLPSITSFTYGKGGVPVTGDWNGNGSMPLSLAGIAGFSLVDAETGQFITAIEDGATLTDLPENVLLVAEAFGGDTVVFDYQGVDDFAIDSDAPFTLTGENPTAFASGAHTLTATLSTEGVVLDAQTITFTVE